MSTRIGVIAEGPIDLEIIAPIIKQISKDKAFFDWPVAPDDATQWLGLRTRGHGGVFQAVKRMVTVLSSQTALPFAFIVILLDHRTKPIQNKIRKLISGKEQFVLAIAKKEIEAWWLADRSNTLAWLELERTASALRYFKAGYKAEKDDAPKRTLHELTQASSRLDRLYGEGNTALAKDFAEFWEGQVRLHEIEEQCPENFSPFCAQVTQSFRRAKSRTGRQ